MSRRVLGMGAAPAGVLGLFGDGPRTSDRVSSPKTFPRSWWASTSWSISTRRFRSTSSSPTRDGERIQPSATSSTAKRPTILQIGYFKCPMLCNLVLNEAMDGLSGVEDLSAGNGLRSGRGEHQPQRRVTSSPGSRRRGYLLEYARPGRLEGVPLPDRLRREHEGPRRCGGVPVPPPGTTASTPHAAALFVITPDGRISRYLYGGPIRARPRSASP